MDLFVSLFLFPRYMFDSSSLLISCLASVELGSPIIDHYLTVSYLLFLALANFYHRVFAFWKSMHWHISSSLNICYRPV
ncbi:hypothetical protein BDW74DRAFT_144109 [Aspergillus multicolor]|uniref:uncharacterized protein n=1 Tax=Aspergillus multicolor TaxID=41759 RepID=UPI003CCD0CF6